MDRRTLAEELSDTGDIAGIENLLNLNRPIADRELADRLREICYETWNSEPVRARGAARAARALADATSDPVIVATADWVSGIAELTRGEMEAAVAKIGSAVEGFRKAGNSHGSAQAAVAMLIPLALLGRYDEAITTGNEALGVFESEGDELAAGKIELNLSNIASRRGEHREAEIRGLAALERFRVAGADEWQTLAENDLANTYAELNDFETAGVFYASALKHAHAAGLSVTEAEIEASLGNLATIRGRFDEALRYLEMSRRRFEELEMPHQTAIAELEIAGIYQALNLTSEAVEIQAVAADALRKLKLQGEEARARTGLGRLYLEAQQTDDALRELARAEELFENEGRKAGLAETLLIRGRIELGQGDPGSALQTVRNSRSFLGGVDVRLSLEAGFLEGESLRMLGNADEAESVLEQVKTGALDSGLPAVGLAATNSWALLKIAAGDIEAAADALRSAIELIEDMREPIPAEEFRMAYLADKLAPYDNLRDLLIDCGETEEALEVNERARARTLAEAIRGSGVRSAESDDPLDERRRDLRRRLNWLYSRIDRSDEEELPDLRAKADETERELTDLSRRIESTRQGNVRKEWPEFSVRELCEALGPDRALVEFIESGGRISALIATAEGVSHEAALCRTDELVSALEGLQFQFGAMRFGAERLGAFAGQLKRRADSRLYELHSMLLKPMEDLIGERHLIVVPSGALNYIPFPALFDGAHYEAERREVISAPGASVWLELERRDRKQYRSSLLVGFADENIPDADEEIEALAGLLPEARVLKGESAKFGTFEEESGNFDIVHLACHGRFRPDSPLFSSLHLADGYVTVRDLCSRRIGAELVTLSACETGMSTVYPGNEILGLARGFLSAGSSTLIVSLWTVSDAATRRLMTTMYQHILDGERPSGALNEARRALISEGAHPYFWAPFAIIGRQ